MRPRRSTDDAYSVSLFPFLAVLISTMGALLILLVVMARQARTNAVAAHSPTARDDGQLAANELATPQEDIEQLTAAAEQLRSMRREAEQALAEAREKLRHGDAQFRELQQQLAELINQAKEMAKLRDARHTDREQAERELAKLQSLIEDTQAMLKEEQQAAAIKKQSYAVVPYEGPHGTGRRPLYLECRKVGVILQPEGVKLNPEDFRGPMGAGNPLAAALRAAEDYYATQDRGNGDPSRVYPLLLVRPDGIAAYYRVRRAVEAWGPDFGYELIDADWDLTFNLPNPQLANLQQHAINLARVRQQALVRAAPRRFGSGPAGSNRADGDGLGGFGEEGNGGWGDGNGVDGIPGGVAGSDTATRGATSARYASHGGDANGGTLQDGFTPQYSGGADAIAGQTNGGSAFADNTASGTSSSTSDVGVTRRPASSEVGTGEENESERQGSRASNTTPTGGGGNTSVGQMAAAGANGSADGANASGSMQGGGGSSTGGNSSAGGPTVPTDSAQTSASAMVDMSQIRPAAAQLGRDWAVPGNASGGVALQRAIHVVVRKDRLVLLPEQGANNGRIIPVNSSIAQATVPFVTAVQQRIQSWGPAGRGLYWQPLMILKVGPQAHRQAAGVRRVLMGSGLEILDPAN